MELVIALLILFFSGTLIGALAFTKRGENEKLKEDNRQLLRDVANVHTDRWVLEQSNRQLESRNQKLESEHSLLINANISLQADLDEANLRIEDLETEAYYDLAERMRLDEQSQLAEIIAELVRLKNKVIRKRDYFDKYCFRDMLEARIKELQAKEEKAND